MKTSVELDEKKVALAKKLGGQRTIKDLLDKALDEYIARARRLAMAELLGTNAIDKKYAKSKRVERAG